MTCNKCNGQGFLVEICFVCFGLGGYGAYGAGQWSLASVCPSCHDIVVKLVCPTCCGSGTMQRPDKISTPRTENQLVLQ